MRSLGILAAVVLLVGCADGASDPAAGGTGAMASTGGAGGMAMTSTGGTPGGTGGAAGTDGGADAQPQPLCAAMTASDVSAVTSVRVSFAKAGEGSPTACATTTETANIVNGQDVNELSWTEQSFIAVDGGSSHPGMCEIEMTWTWESPTCGTATALAIFYVSQ